ncbi:hypothetical protein FFWV33_06260 [Flavobacterium faecale]|uniref:Uncharacterized protein n=1 Tax=Flavobacterium faecale TaxID=1355330 RepID=A0A2S1LBN6_9FLAO|nr:hypothetical protein [Flavobacterium faecale]AWG21165.1 hypothetical protein FFWV33_06260 [Flavobacterium faecale]
MTTNLTNYLFSTNIDSVYQEFWVTYELMNRSPNAILNFKTEQNNHLMSIENSSISLSELQLIFMEHQIKYNHIQS